jgi:general secretion pathway protein C
VKEVQRDRIIIDNGGRFETLMLDGHDFSAKSGTASTRPEPKTETRDRKVVGKPGPSGRNPAARKFDSEKAEMARALRNSPTKFTDFISIAPSRQGGKIVGYKVNPGKDPSLFKAAGLKPNDVLTEINGLDLTDVRQSMEAMNMLRNADFLQLTVSRNGDLTSLDLELPSPDEN